MGSAAHAGAILVMVLFAVGVIGCAITIPICAVKFFAILFENTEEQSQLAGHGEIPLYQSSGSAASSSAKPDADQPARRRSPDDTAKQ